MAPPPGLTRADSTFVDTPAHGHVGSHRESNRGTRSSVVLSFGSAKEEDVITLISKKNYAKAIEVLKKGKADPRAKMQLADVLVLAGKSNEAVVILAPLADEYAREGFAAKAIAVLKKIQKIDPRRRDVEQKLASLIQEKQRVATVSMPTVSSRGGMPEIGIEEIGMEAGPELGMEAGPELGMDAGPAIAIAPPPAAVPTPHPAAPPPSVLPAPVAAPPAAPPPTVPARPAPASSPNSDASGQGRPAPPRRPPSASPRSRSGSTRRRPARERSRRRSWTRTSSPRRTCSSLSRRPSCVEPLEPLIEAEVAPSRPPLPTP